jgi:predicted amidohydrolase
METKLKKTVKIAAARTGYNKPPPEANAYNPDFSIQAAKKHAADGFRRTLAAFCAAGEAGADVVVSVEYALHFGDFGSLEKQKIQNELLETIPGPTTEKVSEISKKCKMFTATNMIERDRDTTYNTTVFIGRDGKIIGKYRKVHLPAYESWYTAPGTEYPVFETDIGRIGFSTCHDMAFPEHCRCMALSGADIILHATGGWGFVTNYSLGRALLQVRAAENCVYIANAYTINSVLPGSCSCIVSNRGVILTENDSQTEDGIAIAEITPDYEMINDDVMWNFMSGVGSERMRFMLERNPAAYGMLKNEMPPLSKKFYPQYKYAKTPEAHAKISEQYDKARQDEFNGVPNDLFKKQW